MEEGRRVTSGLVMLLFVFVEFHASVVCSVQVPSSVTVSLPSRRDLRSFREPFNKYDGRPPQFSRNGDLLTREVRIKQGRLKGIVKEFKNERLKSVEVYLGLPYAAPPVNSLRFMPPGSPPSWAHLRLFDSFAPSCPQTPPDLSHEPFKTMNLGYFHRLKALAPFFANQSEDCLYLNIYAPLQDKKSPKKQAVIVYVHGESFEWNSGNPYDGSILASYGKVVVVTINFRLGILGFLRPGLSEHTVSNFGLLDQIAALQWIKDNIEEFGGDPASVTLMGHGTGAACINFLMVSPVSMASQGLFHKAILMSGTALSDWALTHNPLQFTIQVAEALNCPLIDTNDEMANCLRRKRLSEVLGVKVTVPEFKTPFGPIVDGSVVPNTPKQVMGVYQNLFTRYDLLYGVTEWEAYHSLDPVSLTYGMLEGERDDFLRKYMYSRYEALPFFALATTLSEYLDWRKGIPPARSAAEEHRDLVLDLLSDARFAAPVVQMGQYHSRINPRSYLYVFRHNSKMGEFAESERSISGEEIPYVFGVPLVNEEGPLAPHKFSLYEQLLSESVVTYFTNFAKTGNPNAPRKSEYLTLGPREWQQYEVFWPEYDAVNQSFVSLEIPPRTDHHYRSQVTEYWNEVLPSLLNNPTRLKQHKAESTIGGDKSSASSHPFYKKGSEGSGLWTFGTVRMSPKEYHREKRPYKGEEESPSLKQMDRPLDDTREDVESKDSSTSPISYFVALSVCLLIINAVMVGFYCYKKRNPRENNQKTNFGNGEDREEQLQESTNSEEKVYSVVECADERRKEVKDSKPSRVKRCFTSSTEGTARVKKWIQEEILVRYSKSKKNSSESKDCIENLCKRPSTSTTISEGSSKTAPLPKPILKKHHKMYGSAEELKEIYRRGVQKVSVGVDATPSTRGASVLKQTPIEITKSLDRGLLKIGPLEKTPVEGRRSKTSVSLQMLPTGNDVRIATSAGPDTVKPEHKLQSSRIQFGTFMGKNSQDINVTSRDSKVVSVSELSHGDPLENIQKRNFPKVLPDFPDSKATMRLSFPEPPRNKTQPPPPPPRVSTLQRKNKPNPDEGRKFSTSFQGRRHGGTKDSDSSKEGKVQDEDSDSSKSGPKAGPRREQPSIVIQPRIGPKRPKVCDKPSPKKARVNLQKKE